MFQRRNKNLYSTKRSTQHLSKLERTRNLTHQPYHSLCGLDIVFDMTEDKSETFKTKFDYVLNLVGLTVGFSNIWRFPYICYKNGGGTFILAYLIFILVLLLPLAAIEATLGQHTGKSVVKVWTIVPLFKGLGYSAILMMVYWNSYLPVLLSWTVSWLYASCTSDPVWTRCNNTWNTAGCVSVFANDTINATDVAGNQSFSQRSSVEEFFNIHILSKTKGLHDYGAIKPDLLICLAIVWILAYFSVWKGIGWTSKVVYFTATTPFLMLIILVVRGSTLEGAAYGMKEYLKPDLAKLIKLDVWIDASSQVIFSFGVCSGCLSTISKFNSYKHNHMRDIIFMTAGNAITSFLAGVICFTVLGHLAVEKNTTIEKVADNGPGLVFIVYPTAISLLPLPQLWCPLFFITMLLIGFDSLFVYHEALVCCIKDVWPAWFRFKYSNEVWMAATMFVLFLFGLTMITPGGIYVLELLNNYAFTGWCIFFVALLEFAAVGWVIGSDGICDMIEDMTDYKLVKSRVYLHVMWRYVGPATCLIFCIYSLSLYRTLKLDSYVYPTWANVLGWMVALSSSMTFPIGAVWMIYKADGATIKEKFKKTLEVQDVKRHIEKSYEEEEKMLHT